MRIAVRWTLEAQHYSTIRALSVQSDKPGLTSGASRFYYCFIISIARPKKSEKLTRHPPRYYSCFPPHFQSRGLTRRTMNSLLSLRARAFCRRLSPDVDRIHPFEPHRVALTSLHEERPMIFDTTNLCHLPAGPSHRFLYVYFHI